MNSDLLYTICWDGIDTSLLRILLCYACSMETCVLIGLSYVISSKEKQATFTGREQRLGARVLPHLVARLFDRGRPTQPLAAEKTRDPRVAPAMDLTSEVLVDNDADADQNELESLQAAGAVMRAMTRMEPQKEA